MKRWQKAVAVVVVLGIVTLVVGAVLASFVLGLGNQAASGGPSVGVSAGGAQDATAFRRNVENGYVPQPTDVTYEGLYHDYYFDTNRTESCSERFCPTYSRAVSPDPLSEETDRYVAVGLDSGIEKSSFSRPNVTLIVVVDSSGSMDSGFSEYHYDDDSPTERVSKMEAARRAVGSLHDRLGPGDRLGVVEYDDQVQVVQPVERAATIEDERLTDRLNGISADGGTDISAGMEHARAMAAPYENPEGNRTTRIVYVTDAMPNQGVTSTAALESGLSADADRDVYSTFVGVGVDFNSAFTDRVGQVQGANYYTVDSPTAFDERMSDGFQYMVTPLAFDLTLSVDAPGRRIVGTYGTPSPERDRLLEVSTLFPSRSTANGSEGSVILVEVERTAENPDSMTLTANYTDPSGQRHSTTRVVEMPDEGPHYDSTGARKAVALTRYASLMRNWAAHERARAGTETFAPPEGVDHRELSSWEQRSVELAVTPPYDERIHAFREYFAAERSALGADRMTRDLEILRRLDEGAAPRSDRPTSR